MNKQHYKIILNEVTEEELNEAPALVQKVYRAIRDNEPVNMEEKRQVVSNHKFFNRIPVQMPSFSKAFKRISNVKQAVAIEKKKVEKRMARKLRPGEIRIEGEVGPEGAKALGKLIRDE
jgi:hypothetical protein